MPLPYKKMKRKRTEIFLLFLSFMAIVLLYNHYSLYLNDLHPEVHKRLCMEDEETPIHILTECPAVHSSRSKQGSIPVIPKVVKVDGRLDEGLCWRDKWGVFNSYSEQKLAEMIKYDKGTGCEMPQLDPFSPEITRFSKKYSKIECPVKDWVKCHLSDCRVVEEVLKENEDVECSYRDIIYMTDDHYEFGAATEVRGAEPYRLQRSDHARVSCWTLNGASKWSGHAIGLRPVEVQIPPVGRENTYNVLILGIDSVSKNSFIRNLPRSYNVLTEELKAVILNGYNIVGDGTPAALVPILTGRSVEEMPDVRKFYSTLSVDIMNFIFYKLRDDGYRTFFYEDSPLYGTFQYRFNGFRKQPTDHYSRSFTLDVERSREVWRRLTNSIVGSWNNDFKQYCIGDTPQYKLILNLTDQFFLLDGKKFCMSYIVDISHDSVNMVTVADDDLTDFLRRFKSQGRLKDTLLLVMGDHGNRFAAVRQTFQGKLEERLPFMAVVLPDDLKAARPSAQMALEQNAELLTTPHDIHATILDVIDMRKHWNNYTVTGADYKRALTLLEPIPRSRSCSEAGIDSHWCACLKWVPLSTQHPLYEKAAQALLSFINTILREESSRCATRTLIAVEYVLAEWDNPNAMTYTNMVSYKRYDERFMVKYVDNYQVQIRVGPGNALFEGVVTHIRNKNTFIVNPTEISRINAYGREPSCLNGTKPHLFNYCYCKNLDL